MKPSVDITVVGVRNHPCKCSKVDRITLLSTLETQNHPVNTALSTCQPSNTPQPEKNKHHGWLESPRWAKSSCHCSRGLLVPSSSSAPARIPRLLLGL